MALEIKAETSWSAVVVRGRKKLAAAQPQALARLNRDGTRAIPTIPDVKGLAANGTADGIPFQQAYGTLPANNYNEGTFDRYLDVSGETMSDTILKKRDTCFACSSNRSTSG